MAFLKKYFNSISFKTIFSKSPNYYFDTISTFLLLLALHKDTVQTNSYKFFIQFFSKYNLYCHLKHCFYHLSHTQGNHRQIHQWKKMVSQTCVNRSASLCAHILPPSLMILPESWVQSLVRLAVFWLFALPQAMCFLPFH